MFAIQHLCVYRTLSIVCVVVCVYSPPNICATDKMSSKTTTTAGLKLLNGGRSRRSPAAQHLPSTAAAASAFVDSALLNVSGGRLHAIGFASLSNPTGDRSRFDQFDTKQLQTIHPKYKSFGMRSGSSYPSPDRYAQRKNQAPHKILKTLDEFTRLENSLREKMATRQYLNLTAKTWKKTRRRRVRRRRRRRALEARDSGEGFSCVEGEEERRLQKLWTRDKKTAALNYIEMGWESVRRDTCQGNCTMRLEYQPLAADDLSAFYRMQTDRVTQMTSTLANVFRLQDEQNAASTDSKAVKDGLVLTLARGLLHSDATVSGVTVALLIQNTVEPESGAVAAHPAVFSIYKSSPLNGAQVHVENLTQKGSTGRRLNEPWNEWFEGVTNKIGSGETLEGDSPSSCQRSLSLESMVVDQDVGLKSTSYAVWGLPTFDCSTLKTWTLQYAVPLFGCNSQKLTLRGVMKLDLDLSGVDINQCDDGGAFGRTHRCPNNSQCVPLTAMGFHRGSYQCQCVSGFYAANASLLSGSFLEADYTRGSADDGFGCLPCKSDCESCRESSPCGLQYDILMRGIPMGIESLCITIGMALIVAIIRLRKTKVMKASFWCLLEIITIGSLLLHATVIIQYFEPTNLSCLFVPWLREVGFAIVYGALILKVYRVLAEFQSRKAHRVQVRDKDLFKYLCCIVVVVIGYMAAWTAVTIDQGNGRTTLLQYSYTREHLMYTMCQSTWWDYVVEVGEFLFMAFSIYICYRSRSAPSNYNEVRFITIAICNETVVSTSFYIARHVLLYSIHPDYIFLMYFLRCQLTISVTMILILGPKIWYSHQPPDDVIRGRAYSSSDAQESITSPAEVVKLNTTLNPNGDVEVGEISLADMNPEDIRAELKRLYTQLQIYKTKTMRQDNPHISKRRGGRKQTHRRFSLQTFHNKHRHHQCSEHGEHGGVGGGGGRGGGGGAGGGSGIAGGETEISRTPEESTNSAEGVSIYMDESSVAETTRLPTVTFKSPGNKNK